MAKDHLVSEYVKKTIYSEGKFNYIPNWDKYFFYICQLQVKDRNLNKDEN